MLFFLLLVICGLCKQAIKDNLELSPFEQNVEPCTTEVDGSTKTREVRIFFVQLVYSLHTYLYMNLTG